VGPAERQWKQSPGRREALAALAAFVAGSPLLAAQRDPRSLADHRRTPGFDEMQSVSTDEAMAMVVRNTTSRLTPADLAAMIAYLRALPPLPEASR